MTGEEAEEHLAHNPILSRRSQPAAMAENSGLRPVAALLLVLNFCMYVIVAAIGGWALNVAIDRGFIIGKPAFISPSWKLLAAKS